MLYRLAADAVLVAHLGFIVFVLFGAVLALRWRWLPLLHLPAAGWGIFVEVSGRLCPLTYLENALRSAAGQAGYAGSFIEHYLLPVIYPAGLTRELQFVLAAAVVLVNAGVYGWVIRRRRRHPAAE
jgi:hypothetical protein